MDCILTEHKSHKVVKIEETIEFYQIDLKKNKKEIEESLKEVKSEQTEVDEKFKILKKEYEEIEEKKEKIQLNLKRIIELELNQNLEELIEFKEKMGGNLIIHISEKKVKLFDRIYMVLVIMNLEN